MINRQTQQRSCPTSCTRYPIMKTQMRMKTLNSTASFSSQQNNTDCTPLWNTLDRSQLLYICSEEYLNQFDLIPKRVSTTAARSEVEQGMMFNWENFERWLSLLLDNRDNHLVQSDVLSRTGEKTQACNCSRSQTTSYSHNGHSCQT